MYQLTQINIYPIKSLGGISLEEAQLSDRGLQYDRRWMLIDQTGQFQTQRTRPLMALLQVELLENTLKVYLKNDPTQSINIPLLPDSNKEQEVEVWESYCPAQIYSKGINEWFSDYLQADIQLAYMPETSRRGINPLHQIDDEIVSFADGYPHLIIGEASLADLNNKMEVNLPMDRFRPNLVFSGGNAFDEDRWSSFQLDEIKFRTVKPCTRCVLTTINQENAQTGKEPLKTLATYRRWNDSVIFGQNLTHQGEGRIKVGSQIIPTWK